MTKREPPVTLRSIAWDDAAFEALFRAEYASLVRFAQRYVHEAAFAEELVQDVFLSLWRLRTRLHPDSAVRAYLYRAVRNRGLHHLRQLGASRRVAARLAATAREAAGPDAGHADVARIRRALRHAVEAMPARRRLIFSLARDHGLSYAEIAESLDLPLKTVEVQMGRALQALRNGLERSR